FLVQKGKGGPSDNVGPLNQRVADRLEVALVLALTDERTRILRDASGTVVRQKNKRANHRTDAGRKAFFGNRYTPAWTTKEDLLKEQTDLPADAFLTGLVRFDDGCETVTVTVQAFDKSGKLSEVCSFRARADSRLLTEAGVSHALARSAVSLG